MAAGIGRYEAGRGRGGRSPVATRGGGAEERATRWMKRWRTVVVSVAMECVGDPDAAEDIVQEALAKVLSIARSSPNMVGRVRNSRAWLLRVTRNLAYDAVRTEARQNRIRLENKDDIRRVLFQALDDGRELSWKARRVLDIGQRILTPRQLAVVRLTLQGMECAEIASELGLASGTVRWHRREAIRRLRKGVALVEAPCGL